MELTALSLMSILYLLAFIPSSLGKLNHYGLKWVAGNRGHNSDRPQLHLINNWAGRAERAYLNLQTNYPPFAVAVIAVLYLNIQSSLTSTLCLIYLGARVLHFLSYVAGIVWPRAIFWASGWLINIYLFGYVIFKVNS